MTEKNEYAAAIRSKGCDNTGITEEVAQHMYGTLERSTYAIVRLKHARQINDATTGRKIELVIEEIEPSQDKALDEHLQQLMRTVHQNRVLRSDGEQLTIDGPEDLEPSVDRVIAAREAHDAANRPHPYDETPLGGCEICDEPVDAEIHTVLDDPEDEDPSPADDEDQDGAGPDPEDPAYDPHPFDGISGYSCTVCEQPQDASIHTTADELEPAGA